MCIRLIGRELQSVTQLSVSNRWYVLDQQNYVFRPMETIVSFVQFSFKSNIHIMCVSMVRSHCAHYMYATLKAQLDKPDDGLHWPKHVVLLI